MEGLITMGILNSIMIILVGAILIYFHYRVNVWIHNKIVNKFPHLSKEYNK